MGDSACRSGGRHEGSPMRLPRRRPFSVLVPALLVAATLTVALTGTPAASGDLGSVSVALAPVATGLSSPVALAWRHGDTRMYVAEQGGTIRIVDPDTGAVDGTALTLTGTGAPGERGLLGLAVGPDGDLYVGTGDGGGGGDPDGNGQNLGVLLGKILRIDPTPSASLPYTIPADNPFVGTPGARGEI